MSSTSTVTLQYVMDYLCKAQFSKVILILQIITINIHFCQELELTFSVDQDMFGEVKTTELCPGGKTIRVTNQNK